jgi:hypothetical protein
MGAVAITNIRTLGSSPWNPNHTLLLITATWSASYATGGDTLSVATLTLRAVYKIWTGGDVDIYAVNGGSVVPTLMAGGSYEVRLGGTPVAPTLMLRKGGTTPVEETNATNVSTVSATILVEGVI